VRSGLLLALFCLALALPPVLASAEELTNEQMARESSNPLGRLWILKNTFDNTIRNGNTTSTDLWSNSWTFQPTIPMPLGEGWMIVNRITFPTILRTEFPSGPDESGFGDLGLFSLVGQNVPASGLGQKGSFLWGLGPTFQFPTSSKDVLGSEQYSLGPAGVIGYLGDRYVLAALSQNWFSAGHRGGGGDRDDVEFSWLQVIYLLNLPGGWQVGGKPVITADWESDSDNRWNVPIGLGVFKAVKVGNLPFKIGAEVQYSVVQEDALGNRLSFALTFDPVIPPLIKWPWQD
jgi:hypothetical protein